MTTKRLRISKWIEVKAYTSACNHFCVAVRVGRCWWWPISIKVGKCGDVDCPLHNLG